jgi:hypothetical protein
LEDRPHPGAAPKLSDSQCAHIIALACTPVPEGHDHWTLRLLADRVAQLGYAESFSHEGVRRLLKKHPEALAGTGVVHTGSRHRVRCRDEDVLEVYSAPYDPAHPALCFDESPKQLVGEVREPIPVQPGKLARQDTEYQRNGVRDLMMICEPRRGWREVLVMERRTRIEFTHCMRPIVDL